jgi:hypothetical protein
MAVNILNSISDKDSSEPHALEQGALNLTNPCNLPVLFSLVPADEQEGSVLVTGSYVRFIRELHNQQAEQCKQLEKRCRQLEEQCKWLAEQLNARTISQGTIKEE